MNFQAEITSEVVRGLWDHMAERFGSKTKAKAKASEMQAIAQALGTMGILDPDRFLREYTTTLDDTIYVPFEVGTPNAGGTYGLQSQLVICVHEHHHVLQAQREGLIVFAGKYLSDPTHRAHYEAEAFRCNLEMRWFLKGTLMDTARLAERLSDYAVPPEDRAVAAKELRMSAKMVAKGGVHNETSKVAIAWLKEWERSHSA